MSARIRKPSSGAGAAHAPRAKSVGAFVDQAPQFIRLRGVRQNNLKGFDLDLPLGKLIVITGLSGSGKSSLGFETLYAEGQRRYIETFSPYARQFFDRMDKPAVDRIENIPPAIALEQRNAVRTTRSTVGTMTELCDHMKVLWANLAQLHCRQCGRPVRKDTPQSIWTELLTESDLRGQDILVTFDLPLSQKMPLAEQLSLISRQGFHRLWFEGKVLRVDDAVSSLRSGQEFLTVIQDRLRVGDAQRSRFVEACEQAFHFGKGRLRLVRLADNYEAIDGPIGGLQWVTRPYSSARHCAACDLTYREPSPALFSYNHPLGACPKCRGFGRVIDIDYQRVLPDPTRTLSEVVVKPWQSGVSAECQADLMKMARKRGVPTGVPFQQLSLDWQRWVIEGDEGYVVDDPVKSWPKLWYGVKGYFRWLESKSYKMHVRVLLSRYRSYTTCPECHGQRFNPESLLYCLHVPPELENDFGENSLKDAFPKPTPASWVTSSVALMGGRDEPPDAASRGIRTLGEHAVTSDVAVGSITLAEFYAVPVSTAYTWIDRITKRLAPKQKDPLAPVLSEIRTRLGFLLEVGLGYLTLDRPTRTLSGGETERVNLTTCLGTRLVNTLFVLDEPSVGLHPRDTERLVSVLERLRDTGNTVVVIEHEISVMRAADYLVDIGPGHGESGGRIVFEGAPDLLRTATGSLTADYLTERRSIVVSKRRSVSVTNAGELSGDRLRLANATANNLRGITVDIPLGRFVCVTGVSGSGKSTLVRDVLLPGLKRQLRFKAAATDGSREEMADDLEESVPGSESSGVISGHEFLGGVVLVDQSPLGKTPRSNPAVYLGAFEDIRTFFSASEEAQRRGLNASAFSFNSAVGQCGRCRGAGFEKIEMQFLSDIFVRCPECQGRRYRPHILEVTVRDPRAAGQVEVRTNWSIANFLEASIEEGIGLLKAFPNSKPARRAAAALQLLCDVGLGYLRSGQPINTLSGGESQRLKLASHLANSGALPGLETGTPYLAARPTLFVFDEPTTGLHVEDIRVLLVVFQRLVDAGHTVLVIEHNLDVIQSADWVVDLGPEAGEGGGRIVAVGTPEMLATCAESHTGRFLKQKGIG